MSRSTPVTIERAFHVPVRTVWKALTDKNEMKKWYFDLAEFKPEKGFEFHFYGGDEKKQYLHRCRITEVAPEKKIQYTWRYEGFPGESRVTFELFPEGTGTKLQLTHEGLETFPATNPDLSKERFVEGWTYIIHTSLREYLEKA
jgi:uncharacterized protein YndB with AHSA1/START domain